MTAVISPDIIEEAKNWLLRLRDEQATDADRAAFEAWLAADPQNRAAHARLSAMLAAVRANGDDISTRLAARSRARTRRRVAGVGLAAALCLSIGLGAYNVMPRIYETAIGQQRHVRLADGSGIDLNTNTRLSVRFDDRARRIAIERGEAVFDVAHDGKRPFIVEAQGRRVRAVGTQFAVRIDGPAVSVLVIEGVVAVEEPAGANPANQGDQPQSRLSAGQRISLAEAAPKLETVATSEIERNLAWRSGWLEFNGQPLAHAAGEVSRYTGTPFLIEDQDLSNLRVWAYIRADDLDAFITTLEQNDPRIVVSRDADAVRIRRRPPAP